MRDVSTAIIHFVHKANAWRAACGQDAPKRETKQRSKVTCKACKRTRAFRGKPS